MTQQVLEAKRQVCVAIADEHVLRRHVERHRAESASWEKRAILAVRGGDDELARAALLRKGDADELATTYETQWLDQKRSVDMLREALHALDQRIHEASRQRTMLMARMNRAHAQRTIAATLAHLHGYAPWAPLERMEDRVMQLEADIEAAVELHGGAELSLEAQFAALEARTRIDDDLAALKRRLQSTAPKKALPPGYS
jgi:phage shock protein A